MTRNLDRMLYEIYSDWKNGLVSYSEAVESLQEIGVYSKDAEQIVIDWNNETLEDRT